MDASIELVTAMLVALRADTALLELVESTDIYERAPDGPWPDELRIISLGPSTSIPDDYDCMNGEEITIQWDVWTSGTGESYGSAMCRKICNRIKQTLHDAELALTHNALVTLQWEFTRVLDDPNPAIRHGVVQLTANVETPPSSES